jgi:ribonuclease D
MDERDVEYDGMQRQAFAEMIENAKREEGASDAFECCQDTREYKGNVESGWPHVKQIV